MLDFRVVGWAAARVASYRRERGWAAIDGWWGERPRWWKAAVDFMFLDCRGLGWRWPPAALDEGEGVTTCPGITAKIYSAR